MKRRRYDISWAGTVIVNPLKTDPNFFKSYRVFSFSIHSFLFSIVPEINRKIVSAVGKYHERIRVAAGIAGLLSLSQRFGNGIIIAVILLLSCAFVS